MTQDIELAKIDMSFGMVVDADDETQMLPAAVLTVVVFGAGVPELQDNPVEMLRIMMEQISETHSAGLIVPEKVYDYRDEQADGTPK